MDLRFKVSGLSLPLVFMTGGESGITSQCRVLRRDYVGVIVPYPLVTASRSWSVGGRIFPRSCLQGTGCEVCLRERFDVRVPIGLGNHPLILVYQELRRPSYNYH